MLAGALRTCYTVAVFDLGWYGVLSWFELLQDLNAFLDIDRLYTFFLALH